ncbi:MAG: response regulator, partial [Myxococcales bacterium]|nr:response regulator [Myxococcales bacterium]
MEAIGQLAGGIAHDFNNQLAVITSYGSLLLDSFESDDPRTDDVEEILRAADSSAVMTRQMLAFSKALPAAKSPTDLNESLSQLGRLLKRTLGDNIDLTINTSPRRCVVRIDPVQFDQVILNLALNAKDAMLSGGRLSISLNWYPSTLHSVGVARITVSDTGAGMDGDIQEHIFDPFYSTKTDNSGSGLGLASCYAIINDAGGTIAVYSRKGEGATFTVDLPICPQDTDEDGHPDIVGQGENVLVYESDPSLLKALVRVLRAAGFNAHAAGNETEALSVLKSLGDQVDAVVAEFVRAGGPGEEMVSLARSLTANLAIVRTSGYLAEPARRALSDSVLVWKPLKPSSVVQAVARALKNPRTSAGELNAPISNPFPADRTKPKARRVRTGAKAAVNGFSHRQRVLVVEDDLAIAEASARILDTQNFDVVIVGTLSEARTELETNGFDVVTLDLGLPDGSGLELLSDLRDQNADIPVVMMTGSLSAESAATAFRQRVSDYLPKPFAPQELIKAVRGAADTGRITKVRQKLLAARYGGDEFLRDTRGTDDQLTEAMPNIWMAFQPIVRATDFSVFG